MKIINAFHPSCVRMGVGFVSTLKWVLGLGCNFENTLFIHLPALSSALCSQADKIVGDPRWPKHFVLLWPYRECGKLEGEIRTVDKKREERSCCQCCCHIFVSIATSLGSYKILSFHLEQLLAGSLCNRLVVLKLEWNISKLLPCLTVKSGRWQSTWLMHIIYI